MLKQQQTLLSYLSITTCAVWSDPTSTHSQHPSDSPVCLMLHDLSRMRVDGNSTVRLLCSPYLPSIFVQLQHLRLTIATVTACGWMTIQQCFCSPHLPSTLTQLLHLHLAIARVTCGWMTIQQWFCSPNLPFFFVQLQHAIARIICKWMTIQRCACSAALTWPPSLRSSSTSTSPLPQPRLMPVSIRSARPSHAALMPSF